MCKKLVNFLAIIVKVNINRIDARIDSKNVKLLLNNY